MLHSIHRSRLTTNRRRLTSNQPRSVPMATAQSTSTRLAHLVHVSVPTVWPTQGNFIAKGAPRYYRARLFNGGKHRTTVYPEEWAQSPLPIETFLHIQTRRTRYPQFHQEYSLEFNVTYANVVGFIFEVRTLLCHQWSVATEWASDYAQVDILSMRGLRDSISRLIWSMDYDWRHLPQSCAPGHTHVQLPPGQSCAEPVPKAPRLTHSTEEEASFPLIESESSDSSSGHSSDSSPFQTQQDLQRQQELDELEDGDLDELWRAQWEDIC